MWSITLRQGRSLLRSLLLKKTSLNILRFRMFMKHTSKEYQDCVTTLDIFDTVITRKVANPKALFLLLGHLLSQQRVISESSKEFSQKRILAESKALALSHGAPVTLEQIYECMDLKKISQKEINNVMLMECNMEGALTALNPVIGKEIAAIRERQGRLFFISDMYLPKDFIVSLLCANGVFREGDKIWVSCEYGTHKLGGGLFKKVADELKLKPFQLCHLGDNDQADVKGAQAAGCQHVLIDDLSLNRFENILENYAAETSGLTSLFAGASRLARLSGNPQGQRERAIWDVGCGVAGPVLVAYTSWVLREAMKRNLKTLYFVSRDGEILLSIARKLIKKLNYKIELRYLHGSRQSWFLSSSSADTILDQSWLLEGSGSGTVRSYLKRLSLKPEEISSYLSDGGFSPDTWDDKLCGELKNRLRDALKVNEVIKLLDYKINNCRNVTVDYLKQEGVISAERWGYVDIGWMGRMQGALTNVVQSGGGIAPTGFYFGLLAETLSSKSGEYAAFFFDKRNGSHKIRQWHGIASLMEMFCSGRHGLVTGYENDGKSVFPLLKESVNNAVVKWGLPLLRQSVMFFIEHLYINEIIVSNDVDCRPSLNAVLKEFWLNPNKQEAESWGTFPYYDDQNDAFPICLAPPVGISEIIGELLPPRYGLRTQSVWIQASLLRSPCLSRAFHCAVRFAIANIRKVARFGNRNPV